MKNQYRYLITMEDGSELNIVAYNYDEMQKRVAECYGEGVMKAMKVTQTFSVN